MGNTRARGTLPKPLSQLSQPCEATGMSLCQHAVKEGGTLWGGSQTPMRCAALASGRADRLGQGTNQPPMLAARGFLHLADRFELNLEIVAELATYPGFELGKA